MKKGYIPFISSMIIFGFNGVLANAIPWKSYEIVLARTTIGACFMFFVLLFCKEQFTFYKEKKSFQILIVSGIFMGLNWMFLYEAYRQLGVGLAQIITGSGPALAMLVSPILFQEKFQKHKIIGFLIVIIGMLIICGDDFSGGFNKGLLFGIGGAITYACFIICNHFKSKIVGVERTMWQLLVASMVVIIFIMYQGTGFPQEFSLKILFPVLVIGILNTGIAIHLMFVGIHKLSLQTVAIFSYLEPVSALLFSVFLLKEHLTLFQFIGILFILGGTAFSEFNIFKRKDIA